MFGTVRDEHREWHAGEEESLEEWMRGQQESLVRVPWDVGDVEFVDDRWVTWDGRKWSVSDEGYRQVCRAFGVPATLGKKLGEGLTTRVFNDRMSEKKEAQELVIDRSAKRVVGVVSGGYRSFHHKSLHDAVRESKVEIPVLWEAYSEGPDLVARYRQPGEGEWDWAGGTEGTSPSAWTGVEMRNSMIGRRAVQLAHYVQRLVCLNGMVIPSRVAIPRVFHSGRAESFQGRVNRAVEALARDSGRVQGVLGGLGTREWIPEEIGKTRMWEQEGWPTLRDALNADDEVKKAIEREERETSRKMNQERRAAQQVVVTTKTMGDRLGEPAKVINLFDWVNRITAVAREVPRKDRDRMERMAGGMAQALAGKAA